MKVLVVSDSHGRNENLRRVFERAGAFDAFIHLGDSQMSEKKLKGLCSCPVYAVSGNCDMDRHLPRHLILELGEHRAYLTHGHMQYVSSGLDCLIREAEQCGCDVVMFGHTHMPLIDYTCPGMLLLNPGSISMPRQPGYERSYMIIEITDGRWKPDVFFL